MIRLFLTLSFASFLMVSKAQVYSPDSIKEYQIRASLTDPAIAFELAVHYAWFNPTSNSRSTLLVFMPGTYDNPKNTTFFNQLAANNGYHVVNLKYPNGITAQSPCRASTDSNCYENFRREIIEGIDYSPHISVDTTNSISNRLLKLIKYLHQSNPSEGWDSYYTGNAINWNLTALAGHSQGGGHAALIAMDNPVKRVIMFASPNDFSTVLNDVAPWGKKPHVTVDSAYYGFGNLYDDVVDFNEQYLFWNALGLPVFGDTVRINEMNCPFNNSHQLYTIDSASSFGNTHSNVVRDAETPLDSNGNPLYLKEWEYLLGVTCPTVGLANKSKADNFSLFPNPASSVITINSNGGERNKTYQITRINGAIVKQGFLNNKIAQIPINDLQNGVYIFSVITMNEGVFYKKMIVRP